MKANTPSVEQLVALHRLVEGESQVVRKGSVWVFPGDSEFLLAWKSIDEMVQFNWIVSSDGREKKKADAYCVTPQGIQAASTLGKSYRKAISKVASARTPSRPRVHVPEKAGNATVELADGSTVSLERWEYEYLKSKKRVKREL